MSYTSINGYNVYCDKNAKIVKCDPKLLELFYDCFTLDVMKKPIYIPITEQVYDRQSAIDRFAKSNKDPLTGKDVTVGNLKFIPQLNYFLAMLCLEKHEDTLLFHKPNMNMMDLLTLAEHTFNDEKINGDKFVNKDEIKVADENLLYLNYQSYQLHDI